MTEKRDKRPQCRFVVLWVSCLLITLLSHLARAQAAILEPFETSEPTWRLAESDCAVRVTSHQRTIRHSHGGQGCEYLQIRAGQGSYAYITHQVGQARVIAELEAKVWVKSDRSGVQLLARVVLPRSKDPLRRGPLTTLVRGNLYDKIGLWQQLSVTDISGSLENQLPVLREQFGRKVDLREAYVDLLVLNIYGEAGTTNVWIDDLEMAGHVTFDNAVRDAQTVNGVDAQRVTFNHSSHSNEKSDQGAKMRGWVLEADGKPIMVRMIQYNGESFEWLHSLGFNTIKLKRLPTPSQLAQSRQLGIWLLAPPPQVEHGQLITSEYDRVLAWDLGEHLTHRELKATQLLAETVHRHDPRRGRPLICGADDHLWQYSRIVDILVLDRSPLGSSLELSEFRVWLRKRSQLARAGTPIWISLPTEIDLSLLAQLSSDRPPEVDLDPEQVRLLAYNALAAEARGICFQSRTPLDGNNYSSKLRARSLNLLNRQLALLEPWVSAGSHLDDIKTEQANVHVSVLQTERSRLAIIIRDAESQQYVVGSPQHNAVSFLIPNVPVSARAYVVTPVGLRAPKNRKRVSGGMRITLDSMSHVSLVALTEDPLVVNHLSRTLASQRQEVATLNYEVATHRLAFVKNIDRILTGLDQPLPTAELWLNEAKANLRQSRLLLDSGDAESGYYFAQRGQWSLSKVCRGHWLRAAGAFLSPATSPFCASFSTLPVHWQIAQRMREARWSSNSLPTGDMENLDHMIRRGWRHYRRTESGLHSEVELSRREAKTGRSSLLMVASAVPSQKPPEVVEAAPVWITSAAIPVRAGQLIRIHGWAKVPRELVGSSDGLLIFDSLAGPGLGERIHQSNGWREFTLYRRSPRDSNFTVTIALTGIGQAWTDDVSVMLLDSTGLETATPTGQFNQAISPANAFIPNR